MRAEYRESNHAAISIMFYLRRASEIGSEARGAWERATNPLAIIRARSLTADAARYAMTAVNDLETLDEDHSFMLQHEPTNATIRPTKEQQIYIRSMGKLLLVTAISTSDDAAHAYMERHHDDAVVSVLDSLVFMAAKWDRGISVQEEGK